MRATTATGSGPESAPSNAVTPTPVGIPSPPVTPSAATLDQAAYVSCSPPFSDGGSAIVSYTVTVGPGGITATDTSCPVLVTGLTDGTTDTFTGDRDQRRRRQDGEGASVWYQWTAPAAGEAVRFDTCSANPGVVGRIGAFIGSSLTNLTLFGPGGPSTISCPAGQAGSTITFTAPATPSGLLFSIKFVGVRLTADQPSEEPFTLEWAPQP